MSAKDIINKGNLDDLLKEVSKEYRKINGKKMPAEIILVGGASIIINYGFREMTGDIDAIIMASSSMKEAINRVGDKYELPFGWFNADFQKTTSYTAKLLEFSKYYRTYSNVVAIRTVAAEYLIAMKLMAGRKYKYDLSDVIGILKEHEKTNEKITKSMIETAVTNLYGEWSALPEESILFLNDVLNSNDYEDLYKKYRTSEIHEKEKLVQSFVKESEADYDSNTPEPEVSKASLEEVLKKAREERR